MTKKIFLPVAAMIVMMLSSCELIGDIFKAGFYVGIIVVIAVVALIIWLIRSIFR